MTKRVFVMLAVAASVAACSSHSVSLGTPPLSATTTPVATQTPQASATVTPVAVATTAPFSVGQSSNVALGTGGPSSTPVPVALPSAGGFAPTLFLPLPQSAVSVQITQLVANVAPSGAPALSVARARTAVRRGLALPQDGAVLLYTELFFSTSVTFGTTPSFAFAIPAADVLAGVGYYLALYDPTRPSLGWQYGFEGPAAVSGTTLTFAAAPGGFTFAGNLTYYFALVAIPTGAPVPTIAPSIAPTTVPAQTPPPIPTPSPSASPSSSASPSASPSPSPTPTVASGGVGITIAVPTPAPIVCAPVTLTIKVGSTVSAACSQAGYGGDFTFLAVPSGIAVVTIPTPVPAPSIVPTAPGTTASPTATPIPTQTPTSTPTPAASPPPAPTPPPPLFRFTVTGVAPGTTTFSVTARDGGLGILSVTVTP
jgi:hypothetical protein